MVTVLPLPAATVGAALKTTLLLPRSSFAVAPAVMLRLDERSFVLPTSHRSLAPSATAITAVAGRAPDSRPIVPPATSTRMSCLKRLTLPPMTQTPAPSMVRVLSPLPAARSAALRLARKTFVPLLLAVSLSSGAAPERAILASSVKVSAAAPVPAAMPAEPLTVKLRAVLVAVVPVNSSVAPAERTSLEGSVRAVTPSGLAEVPLPKSDTATVPPAAWVAPV